MYALSGTLRDIDIKICRISADDLAKLEPALAPLVQTGQLKAAYELPDEAQLRNPHHLQALIVACRQRGVEVTGDVEANRFEVARDKLVRVHTNKGAIEAAKFCITSGPWTHALLRQLDLETGIMPIRGQMVLFRCPHRPFQRVINEGLRYLVPRDDGRVLVGSTEEEVGFDKSTTVESIDELTNFACDLVYPLREAQIEATWAGLRPGSFDGFPYIGLVPGLENGFVAAGHFRSGLYLSTGTAVVAGQLIRGERPQIDLSPFHAGRG